MRIIDWLKSDPRGKFALFGIGSVALLCGLIAILIAEFRIEPGDFRNNLVLVALALSFLGATTAAIGYIGLTFGRIARFFEKDAHVEQDSESDP